MSSIAFAAMGAGVVGAKEIIRDAEYYVLGAQYGDKWADEDKELSKKLIIRQFPAHSAGKKLLQHLRK